INVNYGLIVIMLFSSINSYMIILAGITSHSRYALIGGVRGIGQIISYEVPMSLAVLTLALFNGSFSLQSFYLSSFPLLFVAAPALAVLFITLLAETNRTPFDLPEAEAELVAGYNVEYSGILFAL